MKNATDGTGVAVEDAADGITAQQPVRRASRAAGSRVRFAVEVAALWVVALFAGIALGSIVGDVVARLMGLRSMPVQALDHRADADVPIREASLTPAAQR